MALYKLRDSYWVTLRCFISELQRDLENKNTRTGKAWLKTDDCKKKRPEACENWKVLKNEGDSSETIEVQLKVYHGKANIIYKRIIVNIIGNWYFISLILVFQ